MGKYTLKRITKTFSEDDNKKSTGFGTKLALGAATIGGGLLAAKHGAFGAGAQRSVGKGMMSMGFKESGAKTMANAQLKTVNAARTAKGQSVLTGDAATKFKTNYANTLQNKEAVANKYADKIKAVKEKAGSVAPTNSTTTSGVSVNYNFG